MVLQHIGPQPFFRRDGSQISFLDLEDSETSLQQAPREK